MNEGHRRTAPVDDVMASPYPAKVGARRREFADQFDGTGIIDLVAEGLQEGRHQYLRRKGPQLRLVGCGLPELDGVSFRIRQRGESAEGIGFGIDRHLVSRRPELVDHPVEIHDAKVDGPCSIG
jgi:hypothetical protein